MKSDVIRVFVYGTLKPGESNYQRYCLGKVVEEKEAIAFGQLFDLDLRDYPAMTNGENPVHGFLLTFSNPEILIALDQLEDYDLQRTLEENEYYRQEITIYDPHYESLGLAWVYLMNPSRVQHLGGVPIPSGCWRQKR